ncbi:DUF6894 family protein [Methylobacterium sp. A54F]
MSARFFYDLTDGQKILRDDEGAEANGLAEAIQQARIVIDEMKAAGDLDALRGSWRITIRGEDGAALTSLPIR